MTKHLVSTLRKSEQVALKDEFLKRLRIADAVLREFAEEQNVEYADLPPHLVSAVVQACMSGVGFAAEEVRGIRRPVPRSGPSANDDE
jgi:hypothetical protein